MFLRVFLNEGAHCKLVHKVVGCMHPCVVVHKVVGCMHPCVVVHKVVGCMHPCVVVHKVVGCMHPCVVAHKVVGIWCLHRYVGSRVLVACRWARCSSREWAWGGRLAWGGTWEACKA